FGGNVRVLAALLGIFWDDCLRLLAEIRDAIAHGDARRLERAAHTLKGPLGNLSASAALGATLQLESMGRTGDLTGALEVCLVLEEAIYRLKPVLERFVANGTPL